MYRILECSTRYFCTVLLLFCVSLSSRITCAASANTEDVKAIARLYSAAFDREPGIDGLNFWVRSFEQGRSINSIAKDFYNSPEFTKKYGPINENQYIELLYRNILGRDGKQSGIDFWVDRLLNGTSRAVILAGFAKSPENISKTNVLFANMRLEDGVWVFGSYSANASIAGLIEEGILVLVNGQGTILRVAFTLSRQPSGVFENQLNYFSFTNLPVNSALSLYYIKKGEIYALFAGTPSNLRTNVFSLSDGASISLGVIPNQIVDIGKVLPQYSILNQDDVLAKPASLRIPIGLERPPLDGLTIDELLEHGLAALSSGWVSGGSAYLEKVISLTAPRSSAQADAARFFMAFSNLASIAAESASDGNSGSLDRVGDFLDLLGIPDDLRRGSPNWIELPDNIDQSRVTANQFSDYYDSAMRTNTERAANLLAQVSTGFKVSYNRDGSRNTLDIDYGDALFFLASINFLRAYEGIFDAYNTEANLNDLASRNTDDSSFNDYTLEEFLATHPNFMSLTSREQLRRARDLLVNGAITNFQLAMDAIASEPDPQDNDLIRLTDLDPDEIERTRSYLAKVKNSITQGQTLIQADEAGDRSKDLILNLKRFFEVGVDFRGARLLPAIDGNKLDTLRPCLPDPTFNGVVISPDLDSVIYEDSRCN